LMGSIISSSLESMLLSTTKCCPTLTSLITAILHLALPPMASLHLRTGSRPYRSSLFSITTSLQMMLPKGQHPLC
jgi:hypothetical protein